MSAVEEAVEETVTGIDVEDAPASIRRPSTDAKYVARCHNLILSIFPELRETQMGMVRKASPGYRLQFANSHFTVDKRERREYEKFIGKYGRLYAYDDQDFEEIKNRSLEDWIEAKESLNSNNPDGFYKLIQAVPGAEDELRAILQAFMDEDEDRIEEILENEIGGFDRPEVIEAANTGLEKLHIRKGEQAALRAAQERSELEAGQEALRRAQASRPPEPTP